MRSQSSLAASAALAVILAFAAAAAPAGAQTRFTVTNLVSDGAVPAKTVDTNLINPWGIASAPGNPFWVADNGTGVSTLYNTAGGKLGLTVTVAPPAGQTSTAAPTGVVFNGTSDFQVTQNGKTAAPFFLFATEDGTISGWAPSVNGTASVLGVDNSNAGAGAVYKGLALGSDGGQNFLYATDFRNGEVEQFNSSFGLVRAFTDPFVAPGFAPFDVANLDGHLFVTYALQDAAKHDDVAGLGNGFIDEFNMDGTLDKRLVSNGPLDSPWGLVIAPSSFGTFAGDLLVGNFGNGEINAFNISTGAFEGTLDGTDGKPLVLGDLWGLINGNGGKGGDLSKIYFTAGVADEADGLFGSISAVPEPATWGAMILGAGLIGWNLRQRRADAQRALSV